MKGFTLIELLVVISIIAILIFVTTRGYKEYGQNQRLVEDANKLQSILRQAQNNAQTGTVCKIGIATYTATTWNVTLNSTNYILSPICKGAPVSPTPTLQQYSLPSGTTISAITQVDAGGRVCAGSFPTIIKFKNLSSEISFDNGCAPSDSPLEATLSSGSTSKIISIEKGGVIYVR